MTTSWAFFCSTKVVTVLVPLLMVFGLLVGVSSFLATFSSARAFSLSFLAAAVSGLYFSRILNSWVAVIINIITLIHHCSRTVSHSFYNYYSLWFELTSLLVKSLSELVDWRRNLQSLGENSLLPLNTNVFGPFDETAEISVRLNVLACAQKLKIKMTLIFDTVIYNHKNWMNMLYQCQNCGCVSQKEGLSAFWAQPSSPQVGQQPPSFRPSSWAVKHQVAYYDNTDFEYFKC